MPNAPGVLPRSLNIVSTTKDLAVQHGIYHISPIAHYNFFNSYVYLTINNIFVSINCGKCKQCGKHHRERSD